MVGFNFLQDMLTSLFERRAGAVDGFDQRTFDELAQALLSSSGEVSGTRIAQAILDRFESSGGEAQGEWFSLLLNQYDVDTGAVLKAAQDYAVSQSAEHWRALATATESDRQELLRRINRAPGATGRLVSMRAQLLEHLKSEPLLSRVDSDFEHLFSSWFNRGFLMLRRIDWNTPASILEKIIEYEAVHAINDWSDLRRRLEPDDRRCFAFFHPAMPDDPLIFVEVALTSSLPDSVQAILAADRETTRSTEADTAVFYSISNCQAGLRGVSFGNFLIKQVASVLASELPGITTFRTLSPVPGFTRWLRNLDLEVFDTNIADTVSLILNKPVTTDAETPTVPEEQMRALVASYLLHAKRNEIDPYDPVARFHLGNGASLSEIVANADLSAKGMAQSAGVMVSYLYDLKAIEQNHEAYAQQRKVTASRDVENLLRSLPDLTVNNQAVNG